MEEHKKKRESRIWSLNVKQQNSRPRHLISIHITIQHKTTRPNKLPQQNIDCTFISCLRTTNRSLIARPRRVGLMLWKKCGSRNVVALKLRPQTHPLTLLLLLHKTVALLRCPPAAVSPAATATTSTAAIAPLPSVPPSVYILPTSEGSSTNEGGRETIRLLVKGCRRFGAIGLSPQADVFDKARKFTTVLIVKSLSLELPV